MHDLIIIGGGPAGLTAGLYACRAGIKTALLEKAAPGGTVIITDHIENYPGFPDGISGYDLMQLVEKQAVKFGLEIITAPVTGITPLNGGLRVLCDSVAYETRAIIIATGSTPRALKVPGETAFMGKGVSYCATCDAPFFRNKNVVVVGGGDSALEEALFLTRFAGQVTIIHRRDKFRASEILQQRAFANPKIKFIYNAVVKDVNGQDKIESVTIAPVAGQELKFQPSSILSPGGRGKGEGVVMELPADGVFVFIGLTPNTKFLGGLVKLNDEGYIITDLEMTTSHPGVFAAGDVRSNAFRQIITACGDGARAAASAQHYLQ